MPQNQELNDEDYAVLNARFHVPTHLVTKKHLSLFTHQIFDRDLELEVPHLMYRQTEDWVSFHRGDLDKLHKLWPDLPVEDERAAPPIAPITFTATLRPHQESVANQWLQKKHGIMKCPPRFGKTITLIYITTRLQTKTIIFTNQEDLNLQALKSFARFTKDGARVGIVKKRADLDRFDICIATYQMFLPQNSGYKWIKDYKDSFGFVVVDECHRAAATGFSRVISKFNAKYRMGVSATPNRKDGRHVILYDILGPVTANGEVDQLHCSYTIVRTDLVVSDKIDWSRYLNIVTRNEKRNALIVQLILRAVASGHSVIAVTDRTFHIKILVGLLLEKGIRVDSFYGVSKDRDGILRRCISGETQVVIAMRSMMTGIDVPCWSAFFNLTPISNQQNYYQTYSRIRTPHPKLEPEIYDFVDDSGLAWCTLKHRQELYQQEEFTRNPTLGSDGEVLPATVKKKSWTTTSSNSSTQSKKMQPLF